MSGISYDPDRSDVVETNYLSIKQTVTTTQAEAKVGGSKLTKRQMLYIENIGSSTVYYGPSGVTSSGSTQGASLVNGGHVWLPANVSVYLIVASGTNDVIVQEFS